MSNSNIVLGYLPEPKQDFANKLIIALNDTFPEFDAEIYLGYPIYVDQILHKTTKVDVAIVSKYGVYVINYLEKPVIDYGPIQDEIYARVEEKFKKQPGLFKKRKLVFEFYAITFCEETMAKQDDYYLAHCIDDIIDIIKDTKESIPFEETIYEKIISAIQEAYGLNNKNIRDNIRENTKASAINKMASLVERFDNTQMSAILSDIEGIQRIRGLAGSGKTIVLAKKAVELHTAHPDWNIVFTFSTRSLKGQLEELISRLYAQKNDGAKYNPEKLQIMHAWGSSNTPGVYYEACLNHGVSPKNVNDARTLTSQGTDFFSYVCKDLLETVETFNQIYDCILIDEAQDFDRYFISLCSKLLGSKQRLAYAYDELQSLNEVQMPTPEELFGHDVKFDTPLKVCYRNQGPVIVTAHAIGMGLYRKEGLVQMPSSPDVWETIGYVSDNSILEGEEATLYRTRETSPDFLNVPADQIIEFEQFDSELDMYFHLLDNINDDLVSQQLQPKDIMIIDMDTLRYSTNCGNIKANLIEQQESDQYPSLKIHAAGATSPEDFFRPDSIVYTSIRRAKGNEAYMVYIVNAHKCVNTFQKRSDRNALFTAITRSKGWVKVLGVGDEMDSLCDEFDVIKENQFKLHFTHYPTEEELEKIHLNNRDLDDTDAKKLSETKEAINRLTAEEGYNKVQLMTQLFNMSEEELLRLLQEKNNE